jgi:hypothetical protein
MRRLTLLAMLVSAPTLGVRAEAASITFDFNGTITQIVSGSLPAVPLGTPFSGSLTYDSSVPAVFSQPGAAWYNALTAFTMTVGSDTIASSVGVVAVHNDVSGVGDRVAFGPAFQVTSAGAVNLFPLGTVAGFPAMADQTGLVFHDPTGSVFSSTAIPTSLAPASFALSGLVLGIDLPAGTPDYHVLGSFTSFSPGSPSPVPEPASVVLVGAGLSAAALRLRRRTRARREAVAARRELL